MPIGAGPDGRTTSGGGAARATGTAFNASFQSPESRDTCSSAASLTFWSFSSQGFTTGARISEL